VFTVVPGCTHSLPTTINVTVVRSYTGTRKVLPDSLSMPPKTLRWAAHCCTSYEDFRLSQPSYLAQQWSSKKCPCNPVCPFDRNASSQRLSCCSSYSMHVTCVGIWRITSKVTIIISKQVRLLLMNHDPYLILVEYVLRTSLILPSAGVGTRLFSEQSPGHRNSRTQYQCRVATIRQEECGNYTFRAQTCPSVRDLVHIRHACNLLLVPPYDWR
jgi:hypothetical protein